MLKFKIENLILNNFEWPVSEADYFIEAKLFSVLVLNFWCKTKIQSATNNKVTRFFHPQKGFFYPQLFIPTPRKDFLIPRRDKLNFPAFLSTKRIFEVWQNDLFWGWIYICWDWNNLLWRWEVWGWKMFLRYKRIFWRMKGFGEIVSFSGTNKFKLNNKSNSWGN